MGITTSQSVFLLSANLGGVAGYGGNSSLDVETNNYSGAKANLHIKDVRAVFGRPYASSIWNESLDSSAFTTSRFHQDDKTHSEVIDSQVTKIDANKFNFSREEFAEYNTNEGLSHPEIKRHQTMNLASSNDEFDSVAAAKSSAAILRNDTPNAARDSDNDGLSDQVENALGTDPRDKDTDDDGLQDGWEISGYTPNGTKLESADPLQKDLYITIAYTARAKRYSDQTLDDLRRIFAQMPVSNPNGQLGIRVHIATETVTLKTTFKNNLSEFKQQNGWNGSSSVRPQGHHLVVVTPMQDAPEGLIGYGETPGRFAIARDGGNTDYGNCTVAAHIVTHELLHNIVGEFDSADGHIHTENGWLSPIAREGNQYLSERTVKRLNREGIVSLQLGS
jgi:hypothetical protein